VIDSDNFKEERESFIKSYVKKACENVRKNGQEYIMRPLNPAERRMVHMLVKEQGDLTTESLGEGKYKKVKIFKL
jgi:spoIIIJ-associated protein